MPGLDTTSRFPNPHAAYNAIADAPRGLSDEASAALNARLVLLLANHIGDLEVLHEAVALASEGGPLPSAAQGSPGS